MPDVDARPVRPRGWLHGVAVAVTVTWGLLGGFVTVAGAFLVVTAGPDTTDLGGVLPAIGVLMLQSGPFSVIVAGLGLRALRPAGGRGGGRGAVAAGVAALGVVLSVVALAAVWAAGRGRFQPAAGDLLALFGLWPYLVLPASVGALGALGTRPGVTRTPGPPLRRQSSPR